MAIKIPDNLMSRPLTPGGRSDGTENVTRQFGNRAEQAAGLPSTPSGWGGAANPAAGVEGQAIARAAEQVTNTITDVKTYFDGLHAAEEDSRAKVMYLEIDKADAELRTRLNSDPEFAKKTTTEQQSLYETERDLILDRIKGQYAFTQKPIIKRVEDTLVEYRGRSSMDYMEREVKPRVVAQMQINDTASDDLVVNKVAVAPTVENVQAAAANIVERYSSPQAYATYGAQKAAQLKGAALGRLQSSTLNGFAETLEASPLAKLSGPAIDTENLTSGPVSQLINDEKARAALLINQLPIPEDERILLMNKADKYIDQFAKASVTDHNKMVKEAEVAQKERIQSAVDVWQVSASLQARAGGMSSKKLLSEFTKLIESPDFKDNPEAQKRAYIAYDRIDSERTGYEREQRRLASERKTRETIAEMRMDNGIAISSAQADATWKKNGLLKTFFDGGNVVTPTFLQEIEKAGAVPTSVIGSIQTDLASSDPRVQQRGINNLRAIKGFSAKSQTALYRDLPDGFAGVINRVEAGWTTAEALKSLTQPKPTPDIAKKRQQEANKKEMLAVADSVIKEHQWDPKKMSASVRDELHSQWAGAFARADGDVSLARDLFRQDLAKNRKVGVSDFSGATELHPTTTFADKKTVTKIINRDLPETTGKEIRPVFNGMIIANGREVPTYKVFVIEDDVVTEVTKADKPFYMTHEDTAKIIDAERAVERDKAVAEALRRKQDALESEAARAAIAKRPNAARRTQGAN